jgi:hypothetical protein
MKPKNAPFDKLETIPAKYHFNDAELADLARKQGEIYQAIQTLEAEKKHVATDYASRIEAHEAQLAQASNKTTSGYEFRPTECRVIFRPNDKAKDYFHGKTGELVETRPMEIGDFQKSLPLEEDGKTE